MASVADSRVYGMVMIRTPEPELMNEAEQVRAYAEADFSEPHDRFISLFRERLPGLSPSRILDLGCGPGDISRRLARAFPETEVVGLDGAPAMIKAGRHLNREEALSDRVELTLGYLPEGPLPTGRFDTIVSNSLLHHLPDPMALWLPLSKIARGIPVFVMDLLRPRDPETARALVETYASDEPAVLQRDFEHSLHAAYRPDEIRAQLASTGLSGLEVEAVTDRHVIIFGRVPPKEET